MFHLLCCKVVSHSNAHKPIDSYSHRYHFHRLNHTGTIVYTHITYTLAKRWGSILSGSAKLYMFIIRERDREREKERKQAREREREWERDKHTDRQTDINKCRLELQRQTVFLLRSTKQFNSDNAIYHTTRSDISV